MRRTVVLILIRRDARSPAGPGRRTYEERAPTSAGSLRRKRTPSRGVQNRERLAPAPPIQRDTAESHCRQGHPGNRQGNRRPPAQRSLGGDESAAVLGPVIGASRGRAASPRPAGGRRRRVLSTLTRHGGQATHEDGRLDVAGRHHDRHALRLTPRERADRRAHVPSAAVFAEFGFAVPKTDTENVVPLHQQHGFPSAR